jgi:hypothetical protein
MNLAQVDQIAKAVLYEGYMLYPYRPSSVKNRQRFNFGVLYPRVYSEAQAGADACSMRTECLVAASAERGMPASVEVRLRFLHLQTRSGCELESSLPENWQEAEEREVSLPACNLDQLCNQPLRHNFQFPARADSSDQTDRTRQEAVSGTIDIGAEKIFENVFRVSVFTRNATGMLLLCTRDQALMSSLVSTHLVLGVQGGEFISLLEPPPALQRLAAQCDNVGAWPVLVGEPGQRDTMLASPIILYDYPQIAPESAGDLFDGTEIDEILSLRIMTLTEEEKNEIRQSDERARRVLERTENMPAEQFMKMHGAVRGLRPLGKETA